MDDDLRAALCRRDLARTVVRVVSPGMWSGGPLHAAVALRAVLTAAETPDRSLTDDTKRFCAAATFRRCHKHRVGREVDAIMHSPRAHAAFRLLDELTLLEPLTAWCLGRDRRAAFDIASTLERLHDEFIDPSDLNPDTAASLRYAAWLTSFDAAAPPDLKSYARANERAIVALTARPERGFRAAMIAVAYWRSRVAVLADGSGADDAVAECVHAFGAVKGGAAAALLQARINHRGKRESAS
jgi:hypothetical protein